MRLWGILEGPRAVALGPRWCGLAHLHGAHSLVPAREQPPPGTLDTDARTPSPPEDLLLMGSSVSVCASALLAFSAYSVYYYQQRLHA